MSDALELADACLLLWKREVERLEMQVEDIFWSLEAIFNQPCTTKDVVTLDRTRYLVSEFAQHQQQKQLRIHIHDLSEQAVDLIVQGLLNHHSQLESLANVLSVLNGKRILDPYLSEARQEQSLLFLPDSKIHTAYRLRWMGFIEGYISSIVQNSDLFQVPFALKNPLHLILERESKALLQPIEDYLNQMGSLSEE